MHGTFLGGRSGCHPEMEDKRLTSPLACMASDRYHCPLKTPVTIQSYLKGARSATSQSHVSSAVTIFYVKRSVVKVLYDLLQQFRQIVRLPVCCISITNGRDGIVQLIIRSITVVFYYVDKFYCWRHKISMWISKYNVWASAICVTFTCRTYLYLTWKLLRSKLIYEHITNPSRTIKDYIGVVMKSITPHNVYLYSLW